MPWFEDIELGARRELGSFAFTEDNIVAFARAYDPQPFHVDPEAAKRSPYGGLIASGWHIAAIWMKLMMASRAGEPETSEPAPDGRPAPSGGPSPGFLDLKWLKPVRPGDTISFSSTTVEKVDLKSRPAMGIMRSRNEGVNQNGELVFSFIGQGLIERREPFQAKETADGTQG